MKAKFESECTNCGGTILKGAAIEKAAGQYGWEHATDAACEEARGGAEAAAEAAFFDRVSRRDEIMGFHDYGDAGNYDAEYAAGY